MSGELQDIEFSKSCRQDIEFSKSCQQDLEFSKSCRQDLEFSKSCRLAYLWDKLSKPDIEAFIEQANLHHPTIKIHGRNIGHWDCVFRTFTANEEIARFGKFHILPAGNVWKIPNFAGKIWKIQDLAGKTWKIPDLTGKIWKFPDLDGKIWKVQILADKISKI